MLEQTKGLVLRTVPYGDTSLIVRCLTQAFGLQSYLVKGARTTGKKGQSLRPYLQPAALLDLVVYHQPGKNLQYIREMKWAAVYTHVNGSVLHHSIALYMVELLQKTITEDNPIPDLFAQIEDLLQLLDQAEPAVIANIPLYFSLQLAAWLGFCPEKNYTPQRSYFDLRTGIFVENIPPHPQFLSDDLSLALHDLLHCGHAITLYRIKLSQAQRRVLLHYLETYFQLHIEGFGTLRSTSVLEALF